ncbi:MAG: hypothetical protein LBV34_00205, partial [Nocardiopsaceae bacterium]|nr:hypothetical protein [Nocardiopsaceae bacterium]
VGARDGGGPDDGGGPGDGGAGLPIGDADSLQETADMASEYIASLPVDLFPNMVELAKEFAFADADERFELLIDIFVDGLARKAAAF